MRLPFRHTGNSHGATFAKVVNRRKQPVRGLWRRGDRYYAQLTVEDPFTGQKKVRRVLKRARDIDQHIRALPIPAGLNRELKSATPKRPLFTHDAMLMVFSQPFLRQRQAVHGVMPTFSIHLERLMTDL